MEELREKAGKEKLEVEVPELDEDLLEEIRASYGEKIDEATAIEGKLERQDAINAVKDEVLEQVRARQRRRRGRPGRSRPRSSAPSPSSRRTSIRKRIAVDKKRPDGRAEDEIRPIETEVDISPRVHGSALFTRGETQILSNVALGTTRMDMQVDNLGLQDDEDVLAPLQLPALLGRGGGLHARPEAPRHRPRRARRAGAPGDDPERGGLPLRDPGRLRDAGVERLLLDGLGLRLLDGPAGRGRPVTAPVAGVAMGLIKEGDDYIVLTDIAGVEDHLGDMDFKVAGTDGRDHRPADGHQDHRRHLRDPARRARAGARRAGCSSSARWPRRSTGPREKLSEYAPAIESIKIDPEKIGAVIGKGGETIRGLQEEFEAEIDIEDDGTVRVYAPTGELVEACIARIEAMTKEAEVGDRFKGKVVKTTTFGAFVELVKGTDGLLHISNVKPGERVDTVDDVLSQGDEIDVTVVEVDRERGRIGLRLSDDPDVEGKSRRGAGRRRHRRSGSAPPRWRRPGRRSRRSRRS